MLLFTPGPTPIPEFMRMAMSEPTIHHRTLEFESLFAKVRAGLKEILKMREVLMLASSGSGAMEACVTSLCTKKLLSVNSGKFGERFGKIAKAFNIPLIEIKNEWDTPVSLESILQVLKDNPDIDAFCMQVCESAGGLRHPYEEITKAIKSHNPNIMIIIDGITAMGVEPLEVSYVDALIGGSQKAFMLPPGMSIIGISQAAIAKIEERNIGFYFNLKTELKNQVKNTTAWTAPTTIIIGLYTFLEKLQEKGIDRLYQQTRARALATNAAMEGIGLRIYPKTPALAMTTIFNESSEDLRRILKNDFGVNVAGGQDHLKGKIFRINHMGFIALNEISWVINAIELSLERLEVRKFDGRANQIFLQKYYEMM